MPQNLSVFADAAVKPSHQQSKARKVAMEALRNFLLTMRAPLAKRSAASEALRTCKQAKQKASAPSMAYASEALRTCKQAKQKASAPSMAYASEALRTCKQAKQKASAPSMAYASEALRTCKQAKQKASAPSMAYASEALRTCKQAKLQGQVAKLSAKPNKPSSLACKAAAQVAKLSAKPNPSLLAAIAAKLSAKPNPSLARAFAFVKFPRAMGMIGALVLLLFPSLALAFSWDAHQGWNAHQSTFDPKGPLAREQLDLFWLTVWVCGFIFLTVGGGLLWAMIRYREREGDTRVPEQTHGNLTLEVSFILVSIALLVVISIPTVKGIYFAGELPEHKAYFEDSKLGNWYAGELPEVAKDEPLEIIVRGWQWWWSFEYPQLGITTANEFVMPVNKVVKFTLRAQDVIHSFWLPKLGGKVDLMPGRANWTWLMAGESFEDWVELQGTDIQKLEPEAQRKAHALYLKKDIEGYYFGQCAEFCGEAHAYMLFRAEVVSPEAFAQWAQRTQRGAPAPANFQKPAVAASGKPAMDANGKIQKQENPKGDAAENLKDHHKSNWNAWHEISRKNPELLHTDDITEGARLFMGKGRCVVCHAIDNSQAQGATAPNLTFVGERKSLGAGILNHYKLNGSIDRSRQLENLYRWIRDSQHIKPGSLMYYRQDAGLILLRLQGLSYKKLRDLHISDAELLKLGVSNAQLKNLQSQPEAEFKSIVPTIGVLRQLAEHLESKPETFAELPKVSHWLSDKEWMQVAKFLQSLR